MLFKAVPHGMACNAIHNVEYSIVRVKYVTMELFELPFIPTHGQDVLSRLCKILSRTFFFFLTKKEENIFIYIFKNTFVLNSYSEKT